jgi:putative DNA primase/helicase
MVVPIVDIDGHLIGIHATYLRADGSGKADFPRSDLQRECRGVVRGGAIRLAEHDPTRPLIIAEGIETTLSAMELLELPGWSAVNASGLATIELPPAVRNVIVAADHDVAGRRSGVVAMRRWQSEGRVVRIVLPTTAGDDFNDVLMGRRGNG